MTPTADTDDVIEVSGDGLTVRKSFTADEFPVPAIRFEIESDRNEPVEFRLSESIPDSFPMDRVGFHPDYQSDNWAAYKDHHIEFTGTLEPGDSLLTVYGIRIEDEGEAASFMTEPEVVDVDRDTKTDRGSTDTISKIVSEDRNQPVKDLLSGDAETVPGLENDDTTKSTDSDDTTKSTDSDDTTKSTDSDDTSVDLEFNDEDIELEDGTDDESDTDEPDSAAGTATSDGDSLGSRLAAEIRDGTLSDDELETIRSALDPGSETLAEVKINHLRSRVEDVAAYASAFEEFISEHGTGDQLLADLQDEVADLREDIDGIEDSFADADDVADALDRVSTIESEIETLTDWASELKQNIDEVESSLDGIEDLETITDTISDLESTVNTVESDLEATTETVETLSDDLEEVSETVESVQEDVTDIQDWRDQLGSMFSSD